VHRSRSRLAHYFAALDHRTSASVPIPNGIVLANHLVLLPATAIALCVGHKKREERVLYLVIASMYVALNAVVLFVIPFVLVVREARRLYRSAPSNKALQLTAR
jgi:hypothetical protein